MNTFRVDDVVFILSLNGDKYEIVVRDELEKVCYKRTFDFEDKIFEGHEFIRNAWILNHVLCEGFNIGDYVNVDKLECSEENNVKKFTITVNAIIPPGNDSITIEIPCWIDDIEQFAKLYDSLEDDETIYSSDRSVDEDTFVKRDDELAGIYERMKIYDTYEDKIRQLLYAVYVGSRGPEVNNTLEELKRDVNRISDTINTIQQDLEAVSIRQEEHDKLVDSIAYLEQDVRYIKDELHDHQLEERQRRNPYY